VNQLDQMSGDVDKDDPRFVTKPKTEEELRAFVRERVGIDIPDKQVCENHSTPWRAFRDAYFATDPVIVWKASRAFGGKSVLLATLAYTEAITLGASISLLGGSGEQARRVHNYIKGDTTNLPDTFWEHPNAPKYLLATDPTKRRTVLTNGGRMDVLMASTTSVRGPHPQRLRIDEVDETKWTILEDALGQPLPNRGIKDQTVLSSTHQYPHGTMTRVLEMARENGWPVMEWCFRESREPHGWLTDEAVRSKRRTMTKRSWRVEVEMQEPSPEDRVLFQETIDKVFLPKLGVYEGGLREAVYAEKPERAVKYAIGADWARRKDFTVFYVLRYDIEPARVVYFQRTQREPWPVMIKKFTKVKQEYEKHAKSMKAVVDATGLGDVVMGYLPEDVIGFEMRGRAREEMLSDYITALDSGEIQSPDIKWMRQEHEQAQVQDVYSGHGSGHLPDSISAGALAHHAMKLEQDLKEVESWRP
jgi:hypothetical protein